jgi:outer membrane murein-binding lipoprotein Lpp
VVITSRLFDRRGSLKIFDLTRPLRRVLRVPGQVISETPCRSFGSSARNPSSFQTLFCWTLILGVSLLLVSGCGRHKEELESAKQQIEKLNSEIKKLTEEAARLNQEKSQLSEDFKTLSDKNTRMQRELDDLNKAKAALSAENTQIKKKNSEADQEIASLKREKAHLGREVEELNKRAAALAPPSKLPEATPTQRGPQSAKPLEDLSPCDAVLAFMKASEGIVRQQKGTERTKSLEQVKQEYAPRMKGAPAKAIKAAENWVKEGSKWWDESSSDSSSRLLQLRNTVLDACGKSPSGAGFK